MKSKIIRLILFFSIIISGCQKEPDVQTIDQKIERVAKKYIIYGRTPGIIVGTIRSGETKIYSYGVANLETGAMIDEYTIFEIGSITKTFTGLLTAQFVLEAKLAIQDTVNKYLPANLQLPSKNDIPVKLIHLLTHTSGLEREPDDFNYNEPGNYTENQLSAYLARTNLITVPGTTHLYSNLGMGLAGYILTINSDSVYSILLQNRILNRINMSHTFCNLSQMPTTNIAQGYSGNKPVNFIQMNDFFAGAGVIKSNMHDMLIYLENCLNPEASILKDAINLSLAPAFQIEEKQSVGLGWLIGLNDNNQRVAFHDGGTEGFASFIGFNRDKKTGVVVLINSYCLGEQDLIGAEIMKLLDEH